MGLLINHNMEFEENYTLLRDLKGGDVFIDKANCIGEYLKKLDGDRHLLKRLDTEKEYEVPHGHFPIFKKINKS